jgi:hypothetical protein
MKAMDKVSRGKGFRGLLDYLLEREGEAPTPGRLIGGNMGAETPSRLAAEYRAIANLRPDIEKPVWHQALRLPVGETLNDDRWNEIVHEYLRLLGLDPDRFQYTVWSHDDERAVHIAANRVAPDGSVYLGQNENLKSTRITQSLERRFGLTVTKGPEYDWSTPTPTVTPKPTPAPRRKPKKGERQVIERTGELSVRQMLQEILDAALLDRPSLLEFVRRLAAWNVRAIPNLASTGKMNGFSFSLDGVSLKASALGTLYKWGELQRVLAYHPEHDRRLLERLRDSAGEDVPVDRAPTVLPLLSAPSPRPKSRQAVRDEIEVLQRAILETAETTHLLDHWVMAMDPGRQWLELTAGPCRVVAYADRIEGTTGDPYEIRAMLLLARLRGWDRLTVSGDSRFKLAAMTAALREGFEVAVMTDEDQGLLDRARRRVGSGSHPDSDDLTGLATRPSSPRP